MIQQETREVAGATEYHRQLTDVTDLITVAKDIAGRDRIFRDGCSSIQGDEYFTGSESLEEAIDLAEHGWEEGRENLAAMLGKYSLDDTVTHRGQTIEFSYDVAGDEPDIDRYLAGEPEDMVEYHVDPSLSGRNLKLIINASQHAFVSKEEMTRRGTAIALALDAMTASGYGVQLDIAERSSGRNGTVVEYRIPIIAAGGYADMDSLAFSLVHPSFLRRLIFSLNEHEDEELRTTMGYRNHFGYGMPEELTIDASERAVVIDKDDGLLEDDEEIPQFANQLAKRMLALAAADKSTTEETHYE